MISIEHEEEARDGVRDQGEEEEEVEAEVPKLMRDPGQPTERERADHELAAHQPPRAWCKFCGGGRMQHDHHRAVERQDPPEETAIPIISNDDCFMGNSKTAAKDNRIFVDFDNRTQSLGALKEFGTGADDWAGIEVSRWIDALGCRHHRIGLKSDNEVSIVILNDFMSETKSGPTVPLVGPARESKSNGAMETRVKAWQSQFRTLLLDLEENICGFFIGKLCD